MEDPFNSDSEHLNYFCLQSGADAAMAGTAAKLAGESGRARQIHQRQRVLQQEQLDGGAVQQHQQVSSGRRRVGVGQMVQIQHRQVSSERRADGADPTA